MCVTRVILGSVRTLMTGALASVGVALVIVGGGKRFAQHLTHGVVVGSPSFLKFTSSLHWILTVRVELHEGSALIWRLQCYPLKMILREALLLQLPGRLHRARIVRIKLHQRVAAFLKSRLCHD